ncbi:MAG: insulinase family protein [Bacteriovoracaceae bacterium]|nr:insulinase family protein [Bacteriovoracaceae bacterium]
MKTLLFVFLLSINAFAADFRKNEIQRMQWGDFKTTWLEDNRFPIATYSIYFADGALLDGTKEAGTTQTVFDLLFSGTSKYGQETLSEFFDFYGVSFSANVTHEYSVLTFSALVKDLPQVVERFCHVMKEANFPRSELVPHKKRALAKLKNLPSNHSALAERAFRSIMMKGSSYEQAVEGTLSSLELIQPSHLEKRWAQLRDGAPKRFYVSGPREALFVKDQFLKDCGWNTGATQSYRLKNPLSAMGHRIFLVPVPGANQAQIRIGKYLPRNEAKDPDERLSFATDYLGGGFTAQLIQEVRVKRGLTYSIGSYASLQAEYGRAGITTFSKNETVAETIKVIKDILEKNSNPANVKEEDLGHMKSYVVGHYPFGFESSPSFLMQLLMLDHVGEPQESLYKFPEKVQALGPREVSDAIRKLFTWDEQVIVVVGDPGLVGPLSKIRQVQIIKPESLL